MVTTVPILEPFGDVSLNINEFTNLERLMFQKWKKFKNPVSILKVQGLRAATSRGEISRLDSMSRAGFHRPVFGDPFLFTEQINRR